MRKRSLTIGLCFAICACGVHEPQRSDTLTTVSTSTSSTQVNAQSQSADSVVDALAQFQGHYWTELHAGWHFDEMDEFAPRFRRLGPAGVGALVRCLSRSEPSATVGLPDDTSHVQLRKICMDILQIIEPVVAPCDTLAKWMQTFAMGWPPEDEKNWSEAQRAWECTLQRSTRHAQ